MRTLPLILSSTLLLAATAFAQEIPNSQTLDEQKERVEAGKTAVPYEEPGLEEPAAPTATATGVPSQEPPSKMVNTAPAKSDWPESAEAMTQAAPVSPPPVAYDRNGRMIDSEGSGAIPALPLNVMTNGTISYVTGGIGDEDLAQLASMKHQFNVQALFTTQKGEYISDAAVRILDEQGSELLMAMNAGPYFYTQLVPGTYTLEVTAAQGGMKRVVVKVPEKGAAKPQVRFSE